MYRISDVKGVIEKAALAIRENRDYLGELDGKSGDGDLGLSMESAFTAIQETAAQYDGDSFSELFMKAAMSCNKAAPSTMGTLISAGLMSIAKETKEKAGLEGKDVVKLPNVFAQAIMARGKAKPGDKTILDALCPMAETAQRVFAQTSSLREAFTAAAEAAQTAAEATAGMRAAAGRAKWLGERAAEYPDGGAVLCAVLANGLIT